VKDPQDDDVRPGDLVTDLVPLHEDAPDLPCRKPAEPLPEAGLRWYAPDSGDDGTHGAGCGNRVHRLQELVDAPQVTVGD